MPRKLFRSFVLTLSCMAAGMWPSLPLAQTAYAVTTSNQLVSFRVDTPGTLSAPIAITGLQGGEAIIGIDFRPASGHLFAIATDLLTIGRLYTVSTTTGVTSAIGAGSQFALSSGALGFDFNPLTDRIRVVSGADQNMRLNPSTGGITAVDTPLAYAVGDVNAGFDPNVQGSAYTSNFAGTVTTALYGIDVQRDALVIQDPPNGGILNTVGSLGVDATAVPGFDILTVGGVDTAYAVLSVGGATGFYRIALGTGAATLIGNLPTAVRGLALIAPDPPRLVNIATRAQILTGDNVMIAGFVIHGGNKSVAIVATGPSLAAFGIANPLANPMITLVRSSDQVVMASNDDWQTDANAAALLAAGFAPTNALEAAVLVNLAPGAYTAIIQGVGGGTGIAVAGVYEVGGP